MNIGKSREEKKRVGKKKKREKLERVLVETADKSYTYYSNRYQQCYHSKEGAVLESYYKHFLPAFQWVAWKGWKKVKILDLCFGLGYNSLITLLYRPPGIEVEIFSPELDRELVTSLSQFPYPSLFRSLLPVIKKIAQSGKFEGNGIKIELFFGPAEELISTFSENSFQIIYHDPFSRRSNPELWSSKFIDHLRRTITEDGIVTTYASARSIRQEFLKKGFYLYTHPYPIIKPGTIFSPFLDLPFPKL